MAKIEHGEGLLVSVDTNKKTLRFREVQRGVRVTKAGEIPKSPSEFELPYNLELDVGFGDKDFRDLVGKTVEYVLSDGYVVDIKEL